LFFLDSCVSRYHLLGTHLSCRGFHIAVTGASTPTPSSLSPEEVDVALSKSGIDAAMRFYDGLTHRRIFSLPKFIRVALAAEKRVVDMSNFQDIYDAFDYEAHVQATRSASSSS
jgi:hypothetical protein